MNRFGSPVTLPSAGGRPIPEKQIIWCSETGGSSRFPAGMEDIVQRKYAVDPVPLVAFGEAVAAALDRIWIVDEYIFMPEGSREKQTRDGIRKRIDRMLAWMPLTIEASDIRILTKTHKEITESELAPLRQREADINRQSSHRDRECSIQVRDHLSTTFNYTHDRFAIVDDELWHFGGTVGGFLTSVSATSRGWSAAEHGAIQFFELAWSIGTGK
jgi:hypothetical protein